MPAAASGHPQSRISCGRSHCVTARSPRYQCPACQGAGVPQDSYRQVTLSVSEVRVGVRRRVKVQQLGPCVIEAVEYGTDPPFGYLYEIVCEGSTPMQFSTLGELAEYVQLQSR